MAKRLSGAAARDDSFEGGACVAALAGWPEHCCRCKHFYDRGLAALVTPGFAPKHDVVPVGEPHVTTTGGAVISRLAISTSLMTTGATPAFVLARVSGADHDVAADRGSLGGLDRRREGPWLLGPSWRADIRPAPPHGGEVPRAATGGSPCVRALSISNRNGTSGSGVSWPGFDRDVETRILVLGRGTPSDATTEEVPL